MCALPEFVASLALVGLLACIPFGLVHESRLADHVEKHHPAIWDELGNQGKWLMPDDKNYSLAGMQWHLIFRGGYKSINDPCVQKLGRKARMASMASLACLVVIGFYVLVAQNFPSPQCLSFF